MHNMHDWCSVEADMHPLRAKSNMNDRRQQPGRLVVEYYFFVSWLKSMHAVDEKQK